MAWDFESVAFSNHLASPEEWGRPMSAVPGRVLLVNLESFWNLVENCHAAGGGPGCAACVWRWKPNGLVAGDPDECGDAFHAAVKAQQGENLTTRGPAGERWDVRDEGEAARRLPRLSVMFPLIADS